MTPDIKCKHCNNTSEGIECDNKEAVTITVKCPWCGQPNDVFFEAKKPKRFVNMDRDRT